MVARYLDLKRLSKSFLDFILLSKNKLNRLGKDYKFVILWYNRKRKYPRPTRREKKEGKSSLPTDHNNIIANLYVNVNKSFKEFYSYFYNFRQYSNNYIITDDYIVFDNIKPTINQDLERQYLTLQEFYKYSREKKIFNNILSLFFYKFNTITKISIKKEDKIINIYNPYKELSRVISYPEDKDFTHLLTITYKHSTEEENSKNAIFKIMDTNRTITKKINKGIHRLRNYITKRLRDELKKKIKDKELLNKKVRELKNVIFKYFKVYELHKSNHLHAHFMIKLPHFITKQDFKKIINKIAKWFETEPQGIDLKRLKKGNNKGVKRYILKYMFKQFNNNNLFYIENNKNEQIYLIRKEAIIRNDIPRMISRSRNVKTKRFKPLFSIQETEATKEHKTDREITRLEMPINQREANKFNEILKQFKTRKEKEKEREYKEAEKRTEILEKLNLYLEGKYFSIKEILKAIEYSRDDELIQKYYSTIYYKAVIKFNKDLEELEEIINEYDDQQDWIDF